MGTLEKYKEKINKLLELTNKIESLGYVVWFRYSGHIDAVNISGQRGKWDPMEKLDFDITVYLEEEIVENFDASILKLEAIVKNELELAKEVVQIGKSFE